VEARQKITRACRRRNNTDKVIAVGNSKKPKMCCQQQNFNFNLLVKNKNKLLFRKLEFITENEFFRKKRKNVAG